MAREVLGIVIARGGSLGLRNKHLLEIAGRPVISYTLDHARAAKTVTRIVLSSDDEKILDAGRAEGCEVIKRPAKLATARSRVDHVLYHVLDVLAERDSYEPDYIVLLYGNVPLRPPGLIDSAVRKLIRTGADSVRSLQSVGKIHPMWMVRLDGDRISAYGRNVPFTRQALTALFFHDGGVVALNAETFRRNRNRKYNFSIFGKDQRAVVVKEGAVVEIDNVRDFLMVQALIERGGTGGKS